MLEDPRARGGPEELDRYLQADQHPLLPRPERLTDGRHHVVRGQEVGHRVDAAVGEPRRLVIARPAGDPGPPWRPAFLPGRLADRPAQIVVRDHGVLRDGPSGKVLQQYARVARSNSS